MYQNISGTLPPSEEAIEQMWCELEVTPISLQESAIELVLEKLRYTHTNGGAEFFCFQLSENTALNWFAARNRFTCDHPGVNTLDFFSHLLTKTNAKLAMPMFEISDKLEQPLELKWSSAFTLDGELAKVLTYGGAYQSFCGRGAEMKQLGVAFCHALFGERFEDILVYTSYSQWSTWFKAVPVWDYTWFGFDKALGRCWILAVTDED